MPRNKRVNTENEARKNNTSQNSFPSVRTAEITRPH